MSKEMGKVIQIIPLYISQEDEAQLCCLDDNGVIWEHKYQQVKVKVGTRERSFPKPGSMSPTTTEIRVEDVIRRDSYMMWVPVDQSTERKLLNKGSPPYGWDTDKTFKPCEEEEIK